jgi:hypothetical protein
MPPTKTAALSKDLLKVVDRSHRVVQGIAYRRYVAPFQGKAQVLHPKSDRLDRRQGLKQAAATLRVNGARAARHMPENMTITATHARGDRTPAASIATAASAQTTMLAVHAIRNLANWSIPRSSPAAPAVGATARNRSRSGIRRGL